MGALYGGPIAARCCQVGAVEADFGRHQLNIATFHLGRRDVGGEAIALVEVDQPIEAALLAEVQALPHVVRVNALRF